MNKIIILGWILLDQVTKYLVRSRIDAGTALPVLSDTVKITFVRNRGVAFSLFEGSRFVTVGLVLLLVVCCTVWLFVLSRKRSRRAAAGEKLTRRLRTMRIEEAALSLIIAGGIGNLIDRFFRSLRVVDWISTNNYGWFGMERFPTYNIADAAVVVSVILLILIVLIQGRRSHD